MKRTSKNRWAVVELAFCDGDVGLSYEEAGVLHYIAKFAKRNGPVYASLPHISKDTRISERSVQRHIRRLIKLDFLHEKTTGRSRYLTANHAKMASIVAASLASNDAKVASTNAKMASTHAKMAPNPCQNGMLHIEVPIEANYRKESIDPALSFYKELGLVKDKSEPPKLSDAEEKARKEREKAEYLEFKKSLLSKVNVEPVDYSDVPE
jgi:hypothetical protein